MNSSSLRFSVMFGLILALFIAAFQVSGVTSAPVLVEPKATEVQYWNRQLAKIARSVFKLYITPNGGSSYTATAFLCAIELQGVLRSGTYYGFLTVHHGINVNLIVPTAGAQIHAVFDESFNFPIKMHVDTGSWFVDEFLDTTFFELKPDLVRTLMKRHREFLPVAVTPNNRNIEFADGREMFMFATATIYAEPTFAAGRVLSNRGLPDNIYYAIESMPGTSGAPVFDKKTYEVVGMHKAILQDFRIGVSVRAIVSKMEEFGLQPPASKAESQGWILTTMIKKLAPVFHDAVKKDNLAKAKEIIDELRSAVNSTNWSNEFMKPLIEHRHKEVTPLSEAAEAGHLSMIKFLVRDCGADVYYRGNPNGGYSPFLNAAYTGKFDVVKLFLELRPDLLEMRNFFNNTALNFGAVVGHMKIIKLLVEDYHANINNPGFSGRSPLFMAASSFLVEPVKYLASKGANLSQKSYEGENVLHFAARNGHRELVEIILETDGNLLATMDANNETAVHRAAYHSNSAALKYLVGDKDGNQTMAQNAQGRTPFLIAASAGNLEAVTYLTLHGSDITAVDKSGNSALHLAAQQNSVPIAKFIITREPAMLNVKNGEGNDPLTVAKNAGAKDVTAFLSSVKF